MRFEQLLKNAYDSNDHYSMLNNGDYFLHRLAETYDPTYKENYKLLEKAVRQGVGGIIQQYMDQNCVPTKSDTDEFARHVTTQCNFTASETTMILKSLYYMVGWNYPGSSHKAISNISRNTISDSGDVDLKWHKFLVYFGLFAGAFLNSMTGLRYITGQQYGTDLEGKILSALGNYEGMTTLYTAYGILLVLYAAFQIYTRFQLAEFKKNAYLLIIMLYPVGIAISVLYLIVMSSASSLNTESFNSTMTSSIGVSFGFAITNFIYYRKRKHLFVN